MPVPPAGSVIHWRDYLPTHGKYFLLLGVCDQGLLLALTITSQEHWLRSPIHKAAMVEIPQGATNFLSKRSFINCFFGIKRISPVEYEQAECEGVVTVSGRLPTGYLSKVKIAVNNDLMTEVDIVEAVAVIERVLPPRA